MTKPTDLFPIKKDDAQTATETAILAVVEAGRTRDKWFAKIDLEAPRTWLQLGRKLSELVCLIVIDKQATWLIHENEDGFSDINIYSDDVDRTKCKPAQTRFVARAERELRHKVELAIRRAAAP